MITSTVIAVKEIGPGIVQIAMEDRESKNTFSGELTSGLVEAFAFVRKNIAKYHVVVLTGYDSYFSSGGTKRGLQVLSEGKATFADINFYSLSLECQIPVIAAMQGHGIGGGFVLGMFADFVVMSRESVYTTNFMRYGFTPGMGATYILPKKLGIPLGHEMLLGARNYRGEDLAKRGVPFPILPRAEVLPYAHELARELADRPRVSLVTLKAHLVEEMREQLPSYIKRELAMHDVTFTQPEVKERINRLFGN
jgi:polyketide biosynthesis enoyl-CoA hydratase PksI